MRGVCSFVGSGIFTKKLIVKESAVSNNEIINLTVIYTTKKGLDARYYKLGFVACECLLVLNFITFAQ